VKGWAAVFRRELAGLFLAPLAWILLCLTLAYDALFFLHYLRSTGGDVDGAFELLLGGAWPYWFLMMFLPPLITMRMISEESRSGMLEFLLTAPVGDGAVVVGKALAATAFLALALGCAGVFGLATALLGVPPDWGTLASAWIGSVLVAALFSALGLVASALTGTPLVAAFLATILNVLLVLLPLAAGRLRGFSSPAGRWLLEKIDVTAHFQGSFQTGALDSAHVAFFVVWTLALLFVAVRLVESRRWL
jgi:ABC-2 type transport system permease protein